MLLRGRKSPQRKSDRFMNASHLGKYAKDAGAWRDWAKINYTASAALFASGNPFLYFPAATLGHHALEMYLKAALICEGMTVFDPKKLRSLDRAPGLRKKDCVWGHELVGLARKLSNRRGDFDLTAKLDLPDCPEVNMPKTLLAGLELFDPFFSELRYPQKLNKLDGVGQEEKLVLDRLVALLIPFAGKAAWTFP